MKCSEVMKHLHEYSAFPGGDPFDPVYKHFLECPSCSIELSLQRKMLNAMKDMPCPEKSDAQWQQIKNEIMTRLTATSKVKSFPAVSPVIKWAVAAVVMISLVSFNLFISFRKETVPTSELLNEAFPRVARLEGIVYAADIYTGGQEIPFEQGSSVYSGRLLRTDAKSTLSLQLDKESSLELGGSSKLEIVACVQDVQVFKLEGGNLDAKVGKKTAGQIFKIETPNATCEVIGTRFSVAVEKMQNNTEHKTILKVHEGVVKFKNASGKVFLVNAGECAEAVNDNIGKITDKNQARIGKEQTKEAASLPDSENAAVKGSESDARFETALSLIESGQAAAALEQLLQLLSDKSITPQLKVSVLRKAAQCYKICGQSDKSLQMLRLVAGGPFEKSQKESALFEAAMLQSTALGDFSGAIKDLHAYIRNYPEGLWAEEAHFTLAELLHLQKDFNGAAHVYKNAIASFPGSARIEDALYSIARIYSRDLNDCDRALGYFGRIEADFPGSSILEDALFWKGDCLFNQGRASQAISQFNRYLEKFPNGKWAADAKARVSKTDLSGVQ